MLDETDKVREYTAMIVRAFTDFWLDCYSTMLFSLLVSTIEIDKACLYLNNYTYRLADIADSAVNGVRYGVQSYMDASGIERNLLHEGETIYLNTVDDPVAEIKKRIDSGKIVMAGVDLFYWVNETFHYGKNHVLHYSLVFSYDETAKELIVLETGESGNREYRVTYEQAAVAMKAYDDYSKAYRVSAESQSFRADKEVIMTNAKKIIESIDLVLEQDEKILNTEELNVGGILYVNDMVQTHMFNMYNRAKVNGLLFKYLHLDEVHDEYDFCGRFKQLEEQFDLLKNQCIFNGCKGRVEGWLPIVKAKLIENLKIERGIWQNYLLLEKASRN
ncbi:MAG: hypothetical protein IK018_08495 [Lachnospiraceae bacterium]|nr:hypothetical protein [Lachnospiraceae bacterium]